jgi:hypothetical protein
MARTRGPRSPVRHGPGGLVPGRGRAGPGRAGPGRSVRHRRARGGLAVGGPSAAPGTPGPASGSRHRRHAAIESPESESALGPVLQTRMSRRGKC